MIKGLIWNIRGVANTASLRRLRRLVRLHHPLFVVLIEPMVSTDRLSAIQSLLHFPNSLVSSTNKIWLLYSNHCSIIDFVVSEQYLHVHIRLSWDQSSVFATFVYGKCTRSERHLLWSDLRQFHTLASSSPWLIAGDFNVIADLSEYSGRSSPDSASITDFQACIQDCGLLDLPYTGTTFTWTGVRSSGRVWKRLDRALVNPAWLSSYGTSNVDVLARTGSDHCPLLLRVGVQTRATVRPFKFQAFWTARPDFLEVVHQSWSQPSGLHGMLGFAVKLKRLRFSLKAWNFSKVGNIFDNLHRAEEDLKSKELAYQLSGQDADLLALNRCQALYFRALADEEMFWKQKSKLKWLSEGDHNSKFFHAAVQERHARMTVSRIKDVSGTWIEDPVAIQSHALAFFQNLLTEDTLLPDEEATAELLQYVPSLVTVEDNHLLLRPVELEEVRKAVYGLDPDSAPGPDGFTGVFLSTLLGHYLWGSSTCGV